MIYTGYAIVKVTRPGLPTWPGVPWKLEVTQDPEELPDDAIVPDDTAPLPPDPEVKTDAVPDDQ